MADDFIGWQIRRTNRNLLVLGVGFLAVIAAGFAKHLLQNTRSAGGDRQHVSAFRSVPSTTGEHEQP